MKTIILNGCKKEDSLSQEKVNQGLLNVLDSKNNPVTNIKLHEQDIKSCIGCMNCFFKSPGICVLDDIGRDLSHIYINSDIAVFISPITFGGLSSLFAKAYHRMTIQLEYHMFMIHKGELNRKKRYKKQYPSLIAIGIDMNNDKDEQKIFKELIGSNAFRHIHSPKHETIFFNDNHSATDIEDQLKNSLAKIRREK